MKLISFIACTVCLSLSPQAISQTDASLPVIDGTPVPLRRAVVISVTETTIEIQETGKSPSRFTLATPTVFIDSNGHAVQPSSETLKRGMQVRVHFMPNGDQTIIDRVLLE